MQIRQVRVSDLAMCQAIETACFPPGEAASRESIAKRIAGYPEGFLVMEIKDKVVAMVNSGAIHDEDLSKEELKVLEGHDPEGANLVVFSVAVHPRVQGQGLSRPLLEAYFERGRELDKQNVLLICKKPLVGYYERFGFTELGRSPSRHGGAEWFQMRRSLDAS